VTWPVPSQPGVGHLISRFSGLEGSRGCGERAVGSSLVDLKGKRWKGEKNCKGFFPPLFQSYREKPLDLEGFVLKVELLHWKFPKSKSAKEFE